ncbi:hypothetical protein BDN67DRAFT_973404 [Paxillus ammoniavirescens]|nr:hypothetical protein BDN67DRAFT_973404 [Paxillus ammoniavirescens]
MMKSKAILALPDKTAHLIFTNPIDTTEAVTLIAVGISLLNKFLLSKAVKLALSALVTYPVSGSTLFYGVMLLRRRVWFLAHVGTVITLLSALATGMLKPGWSTILKPTPIVLNITLTSKELDLNNIAFDTSLGQISSTNASADIYNAYRTMEIYGTVGGMFSASSKLGFPGAFNFNGVTYNGSTGGILPAVDGYTGSIGVPTQTGLAFSGGSVPAHVQFSGYDSTYRGLSANYTVVQQGFSANVSCQQRDLGAGQQLSLTYVSEFVPVQSSGAVGYQLQHLNVTVSCWGSYTISSQFFVPTNSSGVVDETRAGIIPMVVCPTQDNQGALTNQSLAIVFQGFYEYDFIPPTVCEVNPLVTTVSAQYNAGVVDINDTITTEVLSENAKNVQGVVSTLLSWHATSAQGLTSNIIGDAIFSIYSTQPTQNTSFSQTLLNEILENYWLGVVEFTGTYLRSGFSAQGNFPDNVIPSDMATDVEGTMHVSTMGWTFHSRAFEYIIAPASIVAVIIFISVCVWARYRWWAPTKYNDSSAIQLAFHPDNEVHRVVAVMAGDDLAEVFGGPIGAEVSVEASEMVQFVHENADENHGDSNDSTKV